MRTMPPLTGQNGSQLLIHLTLRLHDSLIARLCVTLSSPKITMPSNLCGREDVLTSVVVLRERSVTNEVGSSERKICGLEGLIVTVRDLSVGYDLPPELKQ